MTTFSRRIYYEDQSDWSSTDFHALWRYLNKLLVNRRGTKTQELDALDLDLMSADTRYLMKHLLILQGLYDTRLAQHTSLAGLRDVPETRRIIHLTDAPRDIYPYFTSVGIYL